MVKKRSYLLEGARTVKMEYISSAYCATEQLNIAQQDDETRPVVTLDWFASTGSKTMQAPSDDDPDPEDEGCY
ncbi:MAG TPA: hypothetical protein DD739_06370 [Ochrobactrum anthropi]|jgi:hypothetical protein|uniref:hypothetical protein n=2 Tax=Brucella TaxID=234 RepID=UPI000466DBF9|nr:hypothetical protein [Brucella rhizosphaerae]HBQ32329.1 hypothetical protein [Brucella anthropi]